MSDFECRCGGMMVYGKCEDCGSTSVYKMDGMTGKMLAKMEADEDRQRYEEENEEEEEIEDEEL